MGLAWRDRLALCLPNKQKIPDRGSGQSGGHSVETRLALLEQAHKNFKENYATKLELSSVKNWVWAAAAAGAVLLVNLVLRLLGLIKG